MFERRVAFACVLLSFASIVSAAPPIPGVTSSPGLVAPVALPTSTDTHATVPMPGCPTEACRQERVWVRADYLLWWMQGQSLSVPVVATGAGVATFADDFVPASGVRSLEGPGNLGTRARSGFRGTVGAWLDEDGTLGLEASGFVFDTARRARQFGSGPTGTPFLGIPYIVVPGGATQVAVVAIPQGFPGNNFNGGERGFVSTNTSSQLWNAECNAVALLANDDGFRLEALLGFRYLDLRDRFEVATLNTGIGAVGPIFNVTGGFTSTDRLATLDTFRTHNQFYGGQTGVRTEYALGNASLGLIGKVGLGTMAQRVERGGASTFTRLATGSSSLPQGYFSGPTNSGVRRQNTFCVIPEIEVKAGYNLTNWMRATVGYDYLFVSSVARAANQLDNRLSASQSTRDGDFSRTANSGFPRDDIRSTSFWAHGLTAGLELSW